MKKTVALAFAIINATVSMAATKLPSDTAVIVGRLDNGITYYIRHNASPRGQAVFHLVHNIGALAEKPEEYGAAHFLEHLMFQGTRNFPDREIVKMLERHGVIYGHDIQARTSENETAYMLSGVSTADPCLLDSCMMVMAEWSNGATLADDKVDHERKVILEEMNMRDTPESHLQRLWADSLLKGSRYENHDVLGTADFVKTVSPKQLRHFYAKWHRPDLECVIVVGDFDAKEMEARLRRIMGSLPKAKGRNPMKDPYQFCRVPDQKAVRFVKAFQPGINRNSVTVINRIADTDIRQKNSEEYMEFNVIVRLFNMLAAKRASEKSTEPGSPFGAAGYSVAPLKRGYLTYQLGAMAKDGDVQRTLRQLLLEEGRLSKVGFTREEMEWGRKALEKEMQRAYRYGNTDHSLIAKQLESVYLDGEPMISNEQMYRLSSDLLARLTLDKLNATVASWTAQPNKTIVVSSPMMQDGLTEEDVNDLVSSTSALDYSLYPYQMQKQPEALPLTDSLPSETTVTATGRMDGLDAEEWTLANGVKVIYKPVADRSKVTVTAVRRGGLSVCDLDRIPAAEQAAQWVMSAGAGRFSPQEMYQQMQLHGLDLKISVKEHSDEMTCSAMPDEKEAAFQILHLYLTDPHLDTKVIDEIRRQTMATKFNDAMQDTIRMMRSGYSPRTILRDDSYYERATADLAATVWKEKFSCPLNFTYVITGNISRKEAMVLATRYFSFSGKKCGDTPVMTPEPQPHRSLSKVVRMNIGREIASVVCSFNLNAPVTVADQMAVRILTQAFQTRCMQNIREKEGGVYAINVNSQFEFLPTGHYEIVAEFNCQPQDAQRLKDRVMEEWQGMVKSGLTYDEYLSSSRSLGIRIAREEETADFWSKMIATRLVSKAPMLNLATYNMTMPDMSRSEINRFMHRMDKEGYKIDVIFMSTRNQ